MSRLAWLTPPTIPTTDFICRRLFIPNDVYLVAAVNGAILSLCESFNWEKWGAATVDETVAAMVVMYDEYSEGAVCLVGSLQLYATGDTPEGTLPCDGSTHLRVDYPRLYAALDTRYIVDADHFVTPNPPSYVGLNYFIVAK